MRGDFLAIDWGTTNRRIYRIDADGVVVASGRDERGILAVPAAGFAAEAAALRARFGDLPMLCAGMVGSNRGWRELPYQACPATITSLAAAAQWVEPGRTVLLPGVSRTEGGRVDVMRGEEVQLLGAVLAGLVPADGLLCQPGTHCKWARLEQGALVDFTTAMTGELYALLKAHSLLATQLDGDADANDPAFARGLADAADGDLLAHLFGVRARRVGGLDRAESAASYVSGLLIGSDVRARIAAQDQVHVLADPVLGALYQRAITALGATARRIDSQAAFAAGAAALWRQIHA